MIEPSVDSDGVDGLDGLYSHVMEVFGRDGWDDPGMDVYNELDPRHEQSAERQ